MTSYLLDSSILIAMSRDRSDDLLRRLRNAKNRGDTLVICEPVAMEYLAGFSAGKIAEQERYLDSFGTVPLDPQRDFRAAGRLYAALRSKGVKVRGVIDCLIAIVAMSTGNELVLIHDDKDFEVIGQHVPLRHERWTK